MEFVTQSGEEAGIVSSEPNEEKHVEVLRERK